MAILVGSLINIIAYFSIMGSTYQIILNLASTHKNPIIKFNFKEYNKRVTAHFGIIIACVSWIIYVNKYLG